ncbi:hypothetical protein [Sanguibacter antarcticus]|uniref:Uncharacterized protein n=1 Tax=Sanguibacter antarcticus TaxID=372484 RepID=A0A2A9E8E9_9MICO|nr:hypothetical protein [Sanguibacter antarcticus]PFG35113.1 hypothetical protein ATL42_3050 [Sanguibacter antarcticus]
MNDDDVRRQQANWFLGGTLLVVSTAAGLALSLARAERLFILAGFTVGVLACWAVNRFMR